MCEDRAIWAAPAHLPDAPWAARGAAPQPLHSLCTAAGLGGQLLLAASPLGLLAAWCAGTLPIMRNESQLSEFLDQRLGAAADSQAARAKAQLAATAAAATAAAEFLPAPALIGAATNMLKECERIQGAALVAAKATPSRVYTPVAAPGTATTAALGAPPPAGSVPVAGATTQPTGGKRLADPNSKSVAFGPGAMLNRKGAAGTEKGEALAGAGAGAGAPIASEPNSKVLNS